ncbi:MAG: circularly permuted type 2 ATP-grasp protein [Psychrobacillus sp.]
MTNGKEYSWLSDFIIRQSELKNNQQYYQLMENIDRIGLSRLNRLIQIFDKRVKDLSLQYLSGSGSSSYFPKPEEENYINVDWIPKILSKNQFSIIESGMKQRAVAFNKFLKAHYEGRDLIVPKEIIESSKLQVKENKNLNFFNDIYVHLYGIDLVTNRDGEFIVLEDNLGFPGGLGYSQEIRRITRQIIPELFSNYQIANTDSFSLEIYNTLASLSPNKTEKPIIIFLQRGPGSVDRVEHRLLTNESRITLVDPEDLIFETNGKVFVRMGDDTLTQVDVIYTRLSPRFNEINRKLSYALSYGKVSVVTHQGNMLPGDKAIFPYIPDLIRHYLNEEPILKQPKTYWLANEHRLSWAIDNIESLVIKSRSGLGGKQVLIGPEADSETIMKWKNLIVSSPNEYIAQELVDFTRFILWNRDLKHITTEYTDLRMYALIGKGNKVTVYKGGMSRFGSSNSQKVNVSLGGGLKDIWIEED